MLAPGLYFAAQWGAGHYAWMSGWAAIPFHRFVHRSFIVMVVAGLGRFLRSLGFRENGELRRSLAGPRAKPLVLGIAVGFGSLAVVLGCGLLAGARVWRGEITPGAVAGHFFSAIGAALAVAFLEELLFRWALYGALRKVYARGFALGVSSGIYALVHFFSRPEATLPITWWSGLALLPRMLRGFGEWQELMPGFLNLLVVGWILAVAYERTGRLWLSIGLHGGWIFWLKTYAFWTRSGNAGWGWFWGGEKVIDGWAALGVLVFAWCSVNGVINRVNIARNRGE